MADSLRTDAARAIDHASHGDRDAKIEQLLLAGLDYYFSDRYEQAIDVWTRTLFFDRSHARARAYIDRARTALAERQRQSEELLQRGAAALDRGHAEEARRLLQAAVEAGAHAHDVHPLLERLSRQAPRASGADRARAPAGFDRRSIASSRVSPRSSSPGIFGRRALLAGRVSALDATPDERFGLPTREPARSAAHVASAGRSGIDAAGARRHAGARRLLALMAIVLAIVIGAAYAVATWDSLDLRMEWGAHDAPAVSPPPPAAHESALPLLRRGEMALDRARALSVRGRLHEALAALETIRATDLERPEADRVRAEIQRQLLGFAGRQP